jgi:3-dehydroquinate dehydratase I
MRPCLASPLAVRGAGFGGPKPLFCVPLVAKDLAALEEQARAARAVAADVVEWRADAYDGIGIESVVEALRALRAILDREPLLFTLRARVEGGLQEISREDCTSIIESALRSGYVDLLDVELCNGAEFLEPLVATAHAHGARVIFSFHDFAATPAAGDLAATFEAMVRGGADVAKIACMPRSPEDVLLLLQATLAARRAFPQTPLCTMSMGALGSVSRVAGFLYGSDMAFAVGQAASAPGQIPIAEARAITEGLLRYA